MRDVHSIAKGVSYPGRVDGVMSRTQVAMGATRWTKETQNILVAAGWYAGRNETAWVLVWRNAIVSENGFVITPAAERALSEFANIRVENHGPGIDCARGGFEINPLLAKGEEDRFREITTWSGLELFPLGEAHDGHAFLAIDVNGRVYLVADDVYCVGANIYEALDSIIIGRRPRKVARTQS